MPTNPNDTQSHVCPNCGYCSCCGRQPATFHVPPIYPYPWMGIYPPNGTVSVPTVWTYPNGTCDVTGWTLKVSPDPEGEGIRWNYTAGQVQS